MKDVDNLDNVIQVSMSTKNSFTVVTVLCSDGSIWIKGEKLAYGLSEVPWKCINIGNRPVK